MSINAIPAGFTPQPDSFRDRVILVTGATGGLGSATSLALARLGATVILVGRTVPKLEKLYDELEATGGPQPAIVPLNFMTATWAEYENLAQTIEQTFGRLDGIVHAAAHFKSFIRLEDLPPRDWLDTLQINLTAPYTLTRLCLRNDVFNELFAFVGMVIQPEFKLRTYEPAHELHCITAREFFLRLSLKLGIERLC